MSDPNNIQKTEICDGKYTHVFDETTGIQVALRHGKHWRDQQAMALFWH